MDVNLSPDATITQKKKRVPKKLPDDVIIIEESSRKTYKNTEEFGTIFEMAICLAYGISFNKEYNYSMEEAEQIKNERLQDLPSLFPYKLSHSEKRTDRYDFKCIDDEKINLSSKTNIGTNGKVCPQVIGQPSKKKFCQFFGLDLNYTLEQIKTYIEINIDKLLDIYIDYTFDCPIIYYNQQSNKLQIIKIKNKIDWATCDIEFLHKKQNRSWNSSATLKINNESIGEFQVHHTRDNIKFRWYFEKLLKMFPDSFEIISL
jgi:hypothetical protein